MWYLVIRVLDLMLSVIFLVVGRINYLKEMRKMAEMSVVSRVNNPLKNLWIWISVNAVGQLANTVQSTFFLFLAQDHCSYANVQTG